MGLAMLVYVVLDGYDLGVGLVLTALYLPTTLMPVGLILRGVAFDFRVKAQAARKPLWNFAFFAGSGIAAASQGWMLGRYITGFAQGGEYQLFAAVIALLLLPAAYGLLAAGWLLMKTEGELQQQAMRWGTIAWAPVVPGMGLISLATPWGGTRCVNAGSACRSSLRCCRSR